MSTESVIIIENIKYQKILSVNFNMKISCLTEGDVLLHLHHNQRYEDFEEKIINVKIHTNSYRMIITRYIVYEYNTTCHIFFAHEAYFLLNSFGTHYFLKKSTKEILEEVIKPFNIQLKKANCILDIKYELFIHHNESYINLIKRLCYLTGTFVIFNPDKSLSLENNRSFVKSLDISKTSLKIHKFIKNPYAYKKKLTSYNKDNPTKILEEEIIPKGKYFFQIDQYCVEFSNKSNLERVKEIYSKVNSTTVHGSFHSNIDNIKLGSLIKISNMELIITELKFSIKDNYFQWDFKAQEHIDIEKYFYKKSSMIRGIVCTNDKSLDREVDDKGRIFIKMLCDTKHQLIPMRVAQGMAMQWVVPPKNSEVLIDFLENYEPIVRQVLYTKLAPIPVKDYANEMQLMAFSTPDDQGSENNDSSGIRLSQDDKGQAQMSFNISGAMSVITSDGYQVNVTNEEESKNLFHIKKGDYLIDLDEGDIKNHIKKGNYSMILDEGDQSLTIQKGDLMWKLKDSTITISCKELKIEGSSMSFISKKDIKFEGANVSIDAKQSLELTSKGKVAIESMQTDIKSTAMMNIESQMITSKASMASLSWQMANISGMLMAKMGVISTGVFKTGIPG